ncbi:MAG TPA: hypothetical protein PL037_09920, partial [Elusimicrobiales bacterium]|nr:hypothetical protein [Elusimicrobiales bacterium]
ERMLKFMGAGISVKGKRIVLRPGPLAAGTLTVPGDISSAAFFIAAALISGRSVRIRSCGLNRLRLGFVRSLKRMDAAISIKPVTERPEPCGTLRVEPSRLRAGRFAAGEVPAMIDEIPLLAVIAAAAAGTTVIGGVEPLRAKESDRIESTLALLASLGAEGSYGGGSLRITGASSFSALRPVETFGDHRIAMAAAAASTVCPGLEIRGPGCVNKSYPGFWKDFKKVFGPAAAR